MKKQVNLEWMTKGETILLLKEPLQNPPQQLQTHNMPTDDVKNAKGTNKEVDLLFIHW